MKLWLTRLYRIIVCDFWLFIYLFEIVKQIFFIFSYPFYFLKTLCWKIPFFFLLYFQSIILACGMCLINLDLKLVQQDDSFSKISSLSVFSFCDFGCFVGFVLWFQWVWFDLWFGGLLGFCCDLILAGFWPWWWSWFDFGWVSAVVRGWRWWAWKVPAMEV